MIGGTQRQLGITAAAGLEAVTAMGTRLSEDHARAEELSTALNALGGPLRASLPQTNIVQVDVSRTGGDSDRWVAELDEAGLRARPLGRNRLRLVTHRHIEPSDIPRAVTAFQACLDRIPPSRARPLRGQAAPARRVASVARSVWLLDRRSVMSPLSRAFTWRQRWPNRPAMQVQRSTAPLMRSSRVTV